MCDKYIYIHVYLIFIYMIYTCMCQRVENRACSRADFVNCCIFLWGFGWGVGGWGVGGV